MSDERYIKLLTEINKYGLDKGCAVEVMAVHNATGQTVKQLCGMHEKEVLQQLIEGYLFQKEQRSKLEAENAALRERLEKAVELPVKIGDTVYKVYDKCDGHNCPYNGDYGQWRCHYEGKRRCKPFIIIKQFCYSDIPFVNKTIFVLREAAEARLIELQGEKQ